MRRSLSKLRTLSGAWANALHTKSASIAPLISFPGVGEVLVKLEAASLNYVDLLVVKGLLNPNLPLPYIPVCDGAGVVEQIGQGVTASKPGDKVVTTFIPDWDDGKPTSHL